MSNTVDALILDLLEWIGPESRPYSEVIEAWRTSCPRLPVWEEAMNEASLNVTMNRVSKCWFQLRLWGRSSFARIDNRPRVEDFGPKS
jgi:hypothetical protein